MTSAMLTDFLKSMALLGAFLLLGVFLRAKVKILQKAFIPASVIGGFLLLIFGPQCLDILPVPLLPAARCIDRPRGGSSTAWTDHWPGNRW